MAGRCAINVTKAGGSTFRISSSAFVVPLLTEGGLVVVFIEAEMAGSPGAVALGRNSEPM